MRWILRLIAVIVVLVALAFGVLTLVPGDKIAGFAAREISARTGRKVTIGGDVKPVFYPVLGVRTGPIEIANAKWADSPFMVKADSLLIGVKLMPLLSGTVKIKQLRIDHPVIRLERAKDGRANWDLSPDTTGKNTAAGASQGGALAGFTLAKGQITNGSFTYDDRQSGSEFTLKNIDLALAIPTADGVAKIDGTATRNGQTVSFNGAIAGFSTAMSGAVSDLSLGLKGGFGRLTFKGRAGVAPVVAQGDLSFEATDVKAALALAGVQAQLPAGIGKTAALDAKLALTKDGTLSLRDATVALDQNKLTGDIEVSTTGRPTIRGKLTAGALDFSALVGGQSGASGTAAAPAGGWSKSAIDASGLEALDADLVLTAKSLDLGAVRFDAIRARGKLENGRLTVDLGQARAYGGTIAGKVVLNGRKGLSISADIAAKQVQLRPLLSDAANYNRLAAAADIKLRVLTSGNSVDRLMRRLSGNGSVKVGAGEIIGFDLAGMLRTLNTSYRGPSNKTVFNSITGTFSIKDGVLSNNDLVMQSPIVDVTGAGKVDLGAQSLDYRATLLASYNAAAGAQQTGPMLPLRIFGPWNNMSYVPDLNALAGKKIEKQRAAAVAKLKATAAQAKAEAATKLRQDADKALKGSVGKALGGLLNRLKKP